MTSADQKAIVDDLNMIRRISLSKMKIWDKDWDILNDAIERIRSKLVENLDIVEVKNDPNMV